MDAPFDSPSATLLEVPSPAHPVSLRTRAAASGTVAEPSVSVTDA